MLGEGSLKKGLMSFRCGTRVIDRGKSLGHGPRVAIHACLGLVADLLRMRTHAILSRTYSLIPESPGPCRLCPPRRCSPELAYRLPEARPSRWCLGSQRQ